MRTIIRQKHITRFDVRSNPDKYYLFGDNLAKIGFGGQAKEMRGEPNAIGIPTKIAPFMKDAYFFMNSDLDKEVSYLCFVATNKCVELEDVTPFVGQTLKEYIDYEFDKFPKDCTVVIPEDGIGTGLAQLQTRAPKILDYINQKINNL